ELGSTASGEVTFNSGAAGRLQLDNSQDFHGTVAGLTAQDVFDLRDINFATVQTPTYSGNSSGGTLTVTDGTRTANIALLGNYLAPASPPPSDSHGGPNIVHPPATLMTDASPISLVAAHHARRTDFCNEVCLQWTMRFRTGLSAPRLGISGNLARE